MKNKNLIASLIIAMVIMSLITMFVNRLGQNDIINSIEESDRFVTQDSLDYWVNEAERLKYAVYDCEIEVTKQSLELRKADQIVIILLTGTDKQKDRVKANYIQGSLYE